MVVSSDDKYKELHNLLIEHEWDNFKDKLNEYIDDIDVNMKDKNNNYFIIYAILFNRLDVLRELVNAGANIDVTDKDGRSVLYYTIHLKYNYLLDELLSINNDNIGVSIIHIKDRDGKTPVHYAVEYENIYALNKLLENDSNISIKDNDGYNALHTSIYTRNSEIINRLIKSTTNINAKCGTGENSLHIAANLQSYDTCKILLENDIDVNALDNDHEFSALHYAVTLGNVQLVKLLLTYGADPNIQDIYGYTSLHYGIIEGSFSCVIELITFKYINHTLNCNLWNIDGKIPIHLFFSGYTSDKLYYIDLLMDKSSMTITDNTGNSLLHYICANKLWKKYVQILENKKLDIFIKNLNGKAPIDYIDDSDVDTFLDIVVTSYINRLGQKKSIWVDMFDNICSREFSELTDKERRSIKDVTNQYQLEKRCREITKKKIKNTLKDIKSGKITSRDRSYPAKAIGCSIKAEEGTCVNFCTYTGSTLDVLIGLIYILTKHSNSCSTLSKNYANNADLCKFYRSMGIVMSSRCEFLNFEIVWVNYKLYIMDTFSDMFNRCIKVKRFVVIPVGIELIQGSHANYLIYDKKLNEIERFEPHGSSKPPGLNYNPDLLDNILEKRFKELDDKIRYVRPREYLPKIGFQLMDARDTSSKKIGDPGGFCALWSLWYTDMRLTYPDMDRGKLVKYLLKDIRDNNTSFKNLIRNYSSRVTDLRDEILSKAGMDINNWLNDKYTEKQFEKVITELDNRVTMAISVR